MNRYRNSNQFEDFEIVGELGKGGQADVFEIRLSSTAQEELNELDPSETFALKRIYKNNLLNRKESLELGR